MKALPPVLPVHVPPVLRQALPLVPAPLRLVPPVPPVKALPQPVRPLPQALLRLVPPVPPVAWA